MSDLTEAASAHAAVVAERDALRAQLAHAEAAALSGPAQLAAMLSASEANAARLRAALEKALPFVEALQKMTHGLKEGFAIAFARVVLASAPPPAAPKPETCRSTIASGLEGVVPCGHPLPCPTHGAPKPKAPDLSEYSGPDLLDAFRAPKPDAEAKCRLARGHVSPCDPSASPHGYLQCGRPVTSPTPAAPGVEEPACWTPILHGEDCRCVADFGLSLEQRAKIAEVVTANRSLRADLGTVRAQREVAEHTADSLRAEVEELRSIREADIEREQVLLRERNDLRAELAKAKAEIEREKKDHRFTVDRYGRDLETTKRAHMAAQEELARVTAEVADAERREKEASALNSQNFRLRMKAEGDLARVTAERDRLATDALCSLSKFTSTPEGGYVREPHVLSADIERLEAERDAIAEKVRSLAAEAKCARDASCLGCSTCLPPEAVKCACPPGDGLPCDECAKEIPWGGCSGLVVDPPAPIHSEAKRFTSVQVASAIVALSREDEIAALRAELDKTEAHADRLDLVRRSLIDERDALMIQRDAIAEKVEEVVAHLAEIAKVAHDHDQTGPADDDRFDDLEQQIGAVIRALDLKAVSR